MKAFTLISLLSLFCMNSFGNEKSPYQLVELNCELNSYYLNFKIPLKFRLGGNDLLSYRKEAKEVVFGWSATECEDITELKFDEAELNAYLKGKSKKVYGQLFQQEPDAEIKATVSCRRAS